MTQGPMGHTCAHFWQMVWEQNCAGIVMLNRCIEKGMVRETMTAVIPHLPTQTTHTLYLPYISCLDGYQ